MSCSATQHRRVKFVHRSFLGVEIQRKVLGAGALLLSPGRRVGCGKEEFFLGWITVHGYFALNLWFVGFGELGWSADILFKGRSAQSCLQHSHRNCVPAPRYSRDGNEGSGFA